MKKQSIKHLKMILIAVICIFSISANLFASSTSTTNQYITNLYDETRQIQKQINAILKTSYVTVFERENVQDINKNLNVYLEKINNIINELDYDNIPNDIGKKQLGAIQNLLLITYYLKFEIFTIQEYLNESSPENQFDLLKVVIQANTLIEQFFTYI